MPGFDGTGPMGYGPGTGRGAGFCRWYPAWGPGYFPSPAGEKEYLAQQIEYLKAELSHVEARLKDLEAGNGE